MYFSFVFNDHDSVEPIGCGVSNVYVGCEVGLLRVVPSFASWFANSLPVIMTCALTFCIVIIC